MFKWHEIVQGGKPREFHITLLLVQLFILIVTRPAIGFSLSRKSPEWRSISSISSINQSPKRWRQDKLVKRTFEKSLYAMKQPLSSLQTFKAHTPWENYTDGLGILEHSNNQLKGRTPYRDMVILRDQEEPPSLSSVAADKAFKNLNIWQILLPVLLPFYDISITWGRHSRTLVGFRLVDVELYWNETLQ